MDSGHTLSFTAAAQRLVKVADALVFFFGFSSLLRVLLLEEFGRALLSFSPFILLQEPAEELLMISCTKVAFSHLNIPSFLFIFLQEPEEELWMISCPVTQVVTYVQGGFSGL